MVVFPFIITSNESWTIFSFLESNAEVASSNNNFYGFLRIALAIATLCFCPPEICDPLTPTFLSKPFPDSSSSSSRSFSSPKIKDIALAFLATYTISSSVAVYKLYLILSLNDPAKSVGS